MGGGAAGWCYNSIAVGKAGDAFDSKKDNVFDSNCSAIAEVAWQDNNNLLITYSVDFKRRDQIVSLTQRALSNDKTVKIHYQPKFENK